MKVGYIRVSSKDQNTARQEVLMKDSGVDKIYMEKVTGKATISERPQLEALMNYVREGDTIVVESVSRFGRNTKHLLELMDILAAKKVEFISLKEYIDTTTPAGRLMLNIFAAIAEMEREYILERQAEGIAIAKSEGRFNGRPPKRLDAFNEIYEKWKSKEMSLAMAARTLGVSRSTLYRKIRIYDKEEIIDY